MTQVRPPFKQVLAGEFAQLFKALNIGIGIKQTDNLHRMSERIATAIEYECQVQATKVTKKLQEATIEAFNRAEDKFAAVDTRITNLVDSVNKADANILYECVKRIKEVRQELRDFLEAEIEV